MKKFIKSNKEIYYTFDKGFERILWVIFLTLTIVGFERAIFSEVPQNKLIKTEQSTKHIIKNTPVQVVVHPTETPNYKEFEIEEDYEEHTNPRYGFTYDDVYLLAQLLCGDESYYGDGEYDFGWDIAMGNDLNYFEIGKVLCVVMNRVQNDDFPNTVTEVILQRGQFVVMPSNSNKTPDEYVTQVIQEWCSAYDNWDTNIQVIPEDHLYFESGPNLTNITKTDWR